MGAIGGGALVGLYGHSPTAYRPAPMKSTALCLTSVPVGYLPGTLPSCFTRPRVLQSAVLLANPRADAIPGGAVSWVPG